MQAIWQDYLTELRQPALLGPGKNSELPPRLRQVLHFLFTTLRFLAFYLVFKPISWLTFKLTCDLHIRGLENIPPAGGCIGTWNHLSNLDSMVGTLVSPRPPLVMTKAEYFKTPVLGGVVALAGGFPVHRGEADRQAIRTALSAVKRGQLLGIFPEGTRSKTYQLQPGHPGAALIASTSDVPVIPIAVWGSENIMRRVKWGFLKHPRVEVRCGKPYRLKEYAVEFANAHQISPTGKRGRHDNLEYMSDIMMLKLAELLPPEYRGDFTVENIAARYAKTTVEA